MRFGKMLLFVIGMSVVTYAADSPFTGKWKLNVAKSKFHPGPALQSESVTIGADRMVTVDETDAAGKEVTWSYTVAEGNDGKAVPVTGIDADSTVIEKRTEKMVEHNWNLAGKSSTGKGIVSNDGKTLTYRLKGTGPNGKPVNNVLVFEKEQ